MPENVSQDHPRICGEKSGLTDWVLPSVGSPPRMRGKVPSETTPAIKAGITPAYAGKSPCGQLPDNPCRDHPRVCEEKCHDGEQRPHKAGITPAYAGKSRIVPSRFVERMDHPRVCGEKGKVELWSFTTLGSPPRMRGKERGWAQLWQHYRITPAYAGKSPALPPGRFRGGDHPRVCGEKSGIACGRFRS